VAFAVLGAIGALAVVTRPHSGSLDILPTMVGTAAGLWALSKLWERGAKAEGSTGASVDRRRFLLLGAGVAAAAATATAFGQVLGQRAAQAARSRLAVVLPRAANTVVVPAGAQLDVRGITPYLTSNDTFYRVDVALQVPQIDAGAWRLKIHGLVDREIELSYDDILAMPLVERRITLTCVSNQVGDRYVGNATWLGISMRALLERAGVKRGADCLVSTSKDDMTISTPLQALTDDRDALLAVGMNGAPLPLEHGFPARMVVPGLYGYVSATKWVVDMEVTQFSKVSTYWTDRGWAAQAPIKTQSRIDVPRQFASVSPGMVNVAGVAYAQRRGIAKVEVRVDDGDWQEARLATEDTIDTWRQWVFPWDATRGQHKILVRATDRTGHTQTSDRVPPRPDGATGWHSTTVNVR